MDVLSTMGDLKEKESTSDKSNPAVTNDSSIGWYLDRKAAGSHPNFAGEISHTYLNSFGQLHCYTSPHGPLGIPESHCFLST